MRQETLRPYTTTDCFLWLPQWELSCPWGPAHHFQKKTLLDPPLRKVSCWSDLPEGFLDEADTLSSASRVPLGWVGGVLWPLSSVALRPTMWRGLGAGDGARVTRKSTRPTSGTSKPCSHIPITRHRITEGGAGPPCASL